MNILRYSIITDIPMIRKLMSDTFGDNLSFTKLFFRFFYRDNVLLYEIDGKIVSMAFLLPATMKIDQKELAMTYLYACATDTQYRKRGLMNRILDKAFHDAVARNEAGTFLLPANEPLYHFYETAGFETFFYCKQKAYFDSVISSQNQEYQLQKITAKEYWRFRSQFLQDDFVVHYPLSHFEFLESWCQGSSNGFYAILKQKTLSGIAFAEEKKSVLYVRELIFNEDVEKLLPAFQILFLKKEVMVMMPGTDQKSALIRWNPLYENVRKERGYFNFPLD